MKSLRYCARHGLASEDLRADIRHIATALNVPGWVAWARKDRVLPLAFCLPCIWHMKQVSLTKFDAGHAAFLE